MFGAMYVVADRAAYLADATTYLEAQPLPIEDAMLKVRRPRKTWTMDDLASSLDELDRRRSYSNGKHMFEVANCAGCHRMDDAGAEFGPDLMKLDPKLQRAEILRDRLEPSARINEKYSSYTFLTKTGRVVNGLVVGETKDTIKVVENPLAKTESLDLKLADIARRTKSPTSIMPNGLLDRLTREEILDLLAYVEARGDRNAKVFQRECGHVPASR